MLSRNYFAYLFAFYLVDQRNIYATSFEVLVFLTLYAYYSFVIASKEVVADYIKKVFTTLNKIF